MQVTLVDQSERFVFKPLLYELLTGGADENEVAPSFLQLLAPYPVRYIQVGVYVRVRAYFTQFIQAKVSGAEPEELQDGGSSSGGRVILDDGTDVEYDWLVVALGSQGTCEIWCTSIELAIQHVHLICRQSAVCVHSVRACARVQANDRGIPGVKELAVPFNTFEDAQRVSDKEDAQR
eukprot:1149858-Pelagomonas_calceolata.AAC.1